ncbi:MAG: RES family NAD+ phosphorylase [Opitutales bacterium]|nr:RES family NAD+ phosphorylase [Opitutales bacterium]
MRAYRISRRIHRTELLSGLGSSYKDGGRWNSSGNRAVYLAGSGSLALVEVLAHAGEFGQDDKWSWFAFEIPDDAIATVDPENLPPGWDNIPAGRVSQDIGDSFFRDGTILALKVPSVIVPFESNLVLNPLHPAAKTLNPVDEISLRWDARLRNTDTVQAARPPQM